MNILVDTILYNPTVVVYDVDLQKQEVVIYDTVSGKASLRLLHNDSDGHNYSNIYFHCGGQTHWLGYMHKIELNF